MNTNFIIYCINSVETEVDLMFANTVFLEYVLNYKIEQNELIKLEKLYKKKKEQFKI
jgi:hypothetical protein